MNDPKKPEIGLELSDLEADPISQFTLWFNDALNANIAQPDAMTLATASKDGLPSARMVLHKGIHSGGFCFYTNYHSPKAHDLDSNPHACLIFFWAQLARQIRVDGEVKRLSRVESEAYFRTRPRESCIGAWASDQSKKIDSMQLIEERMAQYRAEFDGREVPCPPHWGGYVLIPNLVEFWCGRQFRVHDRFIYEKQSSHPDQWIRSRLNP